MFMPEKSDKIFGMDLTRNKVITGGFERENGEAFVYWYPSDIMTSSYEGTVSMQVFSKYDKVRLIDIMDGSVYEIPDTIMQRDEFGMYLIKNLPIKDIPMVLTFGNF